MALENTNLIVKDSNLLFKGTKYKVYYNTVNSKLSNSLSLRDQQILATRNINTKVAAVHFTDGFTEVSPINITEANNLASIETINALRNRDSSSLVINDALTLIEKIPVHYHISELLDTMKTMADEYPKKSSIIGFYANNFYDPGYATNMWMVGRAIQVYPKTVGTSLRLETSRSEMPGISGYIKVENAANTIKINIIIRGIPVPLRRTLTSINYENGVEKTYNYVFTYPRYLLGLNKILIYSIQYIEILTPGSPIYFYGTNYGFKNSAENYNTDFLDALNNLHVINRDNRNI